MTKEEAIEIIKWYVEDAGIDSEDFKEAIEMAKEALLNTTVHIGRDAWTGCVCNSGNTHENGYQQLGTTS